MYTRDMLSIWPMLIGLTSLVLLIMYVLDIYILYNFGLLQTYHHYIPLLFMKILLCFLQLAIVLGTAVLDVNES